MKNILTITDGSKTYSFNLDNFDILESTRARSEFERLVYEAFLEFNDYRRNINKEIYETRMFLSKIASEAQPVLRNEIFDFLNKKETK